jgi:hypothetical protein
MVARRPNVRRSSGAATIITESPTNSTGGPDRADAAAVAGASGAGAADASCASRAGTSATPAITATSAATAPAVAMRRTTSRDVLPGPVSAEITPRTPWRRNGTSTKRYDSAAATTVSSTCAVTRGAPPMGTSSPERVRWITGQCHR